MSKTVGIVLVLGLLGVAAFIVISRKPVAKPDPLGQLLGAAPAVIGAAGNIGGSLVSGIKKLF